MPLDIVFRLSDQDLDHFQTIMDRAKETIEDMQGTGSIAATARQMISDAKSKELPGFIVDRLSKLEVVINMVDDQEWQLSVAECKRVLGALIYFCDPDDLIPDHIPGLGFIDDAIYVEIIIRELQAEIESYEEFCEFRSAKEKWREENGQDPHVKREEWLADKRATLHERMRRSGRGGGWRLRW